MKGCLLLQRRFAYIGHYIALELKQKYGIENFCGYVYLRTSLNFLKLQTDIRYSTLLLDEDIHERYKTEKLDPVYLTYLEKEFGIPFLWPYLAIDRVLMSNQLIREYPYNKPPFTHEEMLRILQVHAKVIIKMLEEEKPDFVFGSVVGGIGSMLLWNIAKKFGVKTIIVLPTCIRNSYILSEDPCTFTSIDAKYKNIEATNSPSRIVAKEFLEEFRKSPQPYFEKFTPRHQPVSRSKQFKFLNPLKGYKSFATFFREIIKHLSSKEKYDYSYIGPWNYLRDTLKRKARNLIGTNDLYEPFDPQEDFAFFPLHYEPETSLLLQAPYYTNQAHLIGQIARSLPVQYKLVVKEHPQMVEYRPRSFYKELKKSPNVKIVSPKINSFAIIPFAKLITTIAGTVGWEGILLNKPVITFGHQFYNTLSSVKHCLDIENLPNLVNEAINTPRPNDDELINYLTAIFEDSETFELHRLWTEETDVNKKIEGVRPIAELLAKYLKII